MCVKDTSLRSMIFSTITKTSSSLLPSFRTLNLGRVLLLRLRFDYPVYQGNPGEQAPERGLGTENINASSHAAYAVPQTVPGFPSVRRVSAITTLRICHAFFPSAKPNIGMRN